MGIRNAIKRLQQRLQKTPSDGIWCEGGDGESVEEAIIIRGANHDMLGTWAEFMWLQWKFGEKGRDWNLIFHSTGARGDRQIDTVRIELPGGEQRDFFFDITESFGEWPDLP
jgi:hypothetical protein